MKKRIGVDIGGTTIKIGIVEEDGTISAKSVINTEKTADAVIDTLAAAIEKLLSENGLNEHKIKGIGIGCPGSVTAKTGVVEFSGNLHWDKVELVKGLKSRINTEYRLTNDANAAAYGETVYGAAKGFSDVVMFTLGTGVGGGIIIDKKLYEGNESKGGEVGHTLLVMNGEECTCGRKGCIEAYISATALIRDTKRAMTKDASSKMWDYADNDINNVNGRTAFAMEKEGDAAATEVVNNYVAYLSEAIMDYCNIFRPEAFVIGGGISGEGKNLTDRIEAYCEPRFYGFKGTPKVKILTATLGNDAGIIGAAALL